MDHYYHICFGKFFKDILITMIGLGTGYNFYTAGYPAI